MSTLRHLLIFPLAALTALLPVAPAAADVDPELDIQYSEELPLAAKSLLLDIAGMPEGGLVAVGERGHVILSADGGAWQQARVVPTRSTLTSVAVVGDRIWAAGHDTVILTSGDTGKTWTLQNFDPGRQQPIMDIHFFDAQRGMAVGAYDLYLFTEDGGKTWDEDFINEEEWHNNAILDLGDGRLMIAGEAGFTYRTADRGASWETIEMPYGGSMFGIVSSGETCVLVFGLRGNVQESCDFGDSWQELDTGTELTIAGGVRSDGKILLVGNSGLVIERQDGGAFEVHQHSSGVDFARAIELGDDRFLLVGEDGVHEFPERSIDDG